MSLIDDILKKENNEENTQDSLTVPAQDFIASTAEDYDKFNEAAWAAGNGYETKTFPIFDKKMEGLQEGLYLFAGESNHGKSCILLELICAYCKNKDNKLFGIYFSLDDTRYKLIPRVIAADQRIPISAVSKPQRYQNLIDAGDTNSDVYEEDLKKREIGFQRLKESTNQFKIVDSSEITCGEQLIDYCIKLQAYIRARFGEDANIIVGIDSVSDIRWKDKRFYSENDMNVFTAREVKRLAVEILHAPVFGSIHLRKVDQHKRPTIADVKESGTYVYEADLVFIVYNDVSRNKQSASIYGIGENGEKQAVIELDWAKNKVSAFKGRTYQHFFTNYSKVIECDEDEMKRYNALIYTV